MDPSTRDQRLGSQPGFDDWADEVVATVAARRLAADGSQNRGARGAHAASAEPVPPGKTKRLKRRWRFLFGCLS